MLSRYTTPEMKNIWSSSEQFRSDIKNFLNCKTSGIDFELTTFNLQLKYSLGLILRKIDRLKNALKKKAHEHKYTACIGRTHGMHAEPTTFGIKMAQAYVEFCRHEQRLQNARDETCVVVFKDGQFDPKIEKYIMDHLGLGQETFQIPFFQYKMQLAVLKVVAGSIERLALEFRNLQRTEIGEVRECFSEGQIGSSAMPHKKNPILSENLCGLSRLMRTSIRLSDWELSVLDFALNRLSGVVETLEVDKKAMKRNLGLTGSAIHSQRVMLELIKRGMDRQTAHRVVQRLVDGKKDKRIKKLLTKKEIENLQDIEYYLKRVDFIFERVFNE